MGELRSTIAGPLVITDRLRAAGVAAALAAAETGVAAEGGARFLNLSVLTSFSWTSTSWDVMSSASLQMRITSLSYMANHKSNDGLSYTTNPLSMFSSVDCEGDATW